ncbi:MAG: TerB family tellurite resistance protein [Bacteroidetes bacterium]|nr:TerB family tellurite resistance protein [Bacteroidota bacterium]
MNKATAGYHMLMILSAVDGKFNGQEDIIIKKFLEENFGDLSNLDNELAIISALKSEDYPVHFNNAMNQFYLDSNKGERNHFLDMATRLIAADKEISARENLFINELYKAWTEEIED